jgi:hypothetical protein
VGLTLLTVFFAGVLGGGIAANVTVIVVLAAIALILVAAYNGLRSLLYLLEPGGCRPPDPPLSATNSRKVSRES